MVLELLRLIIDFGFMVLIWAVQLVIYPSFKYYNSSNLILWHQTYTKRVIVIVLPLMVTQLLLSVVHLFEILNWYSIVSFAIILMLWALTFLIFVPLHVSIDKGNPAENVCVKLVQKNWVRTCLWSLLFFISFFYFLSIQK